MTRFNHWSRRLLLQTALCAPAVAWSLARTRTVPAKEAIQPLPLECVRLAPSPFLTAVQVNSAYLQRIEPDRLLHNFRVSASLPPKGAVYGGWESESLAGHTLGHYLSACSLMYAQTGEVEFRRRVDYIVSELAQCQAAHGDGYVAGFTRKKGMGYEDGKAIFAEVSRGEIRSQPFNLNGAWSPLYTLHKLFAGLLDAQRYCGNQDALRVARLLGQFLERVFSALTDAQMQQLLATEYGGLNESFVQLHARTGDAQWLALSQRLYDRKVLDPLTQSRDELIGLHSNTQVPKIIGLARLHTATGQANYATAARFFWETVTRNHSYVIGGNADRESFEAPLSRYVTEQTCESCNTYNMLKLTRHLYEWHQDPSYFDYYERAHLNHILAQHDPATGMFAYMMPLMSGARREFSTPFDDFWCCVGSGMESHSKHGDSIFWQRTDQLFINLYIASQLTWKEQDAAITLQTDYPASGEVVVAVSSLARPKTFAISLRIPGWCKRAAVRINGKVAALQPADGYVTVRRRWRRGDRVELDLGMTLRAEAVADNVDLVALLRGPLVMAADLGACAEPLDSAFVDLPPALLGESTTAALARITGSETLSTGTATRPMNLPLRPFYAQYDRRSAVYFPRMTEQQWADAQTAAAAQRTRVVQLNASSLDVVQPGDPKSEAEHSFKDNGSEAVLYRGRPGRLGRGGAWFEFRFHCGPDPTVLQLTYWGRQRNNRLSIHADGVLIARDAVEPDAIEFITRTYVIPQLVTQGKQSVVLRFVPGENAGAGPIFGCRILPAGWASA